MEQHSDVDSHIGCSCFCNFMTTAFTSEENDYLHTNIKIYQSTRQTDRAHLNFVPPISFTLCMSKISSFSPVQRGLLLLLCKSLFNLFSLFACPHFKLLCHLFLFLVSCMHAIRVFSAPALLLAIWQLCSWPQPLACPMGLKGAWMPPPGVIWCCCTHPFTLVTRARHVPSLRIFYDSLLPHSSLPKRGITLSDTK